MSSSPKKPKVLQQLQALGRILAIPDRNKFFRFYNTVQLLVTKNSGAHTCAVDKAAANAHRNKQGLLFRIFLKSNP